MKQTVNNWEAFVLSLLISLVAGTVVAGFVYVFRQPWSWDVFLGSGGIALFFCIYAYWIRPSGINDSKKR